MARKKSARTLRKNRQRVQANYYRKILEKTFRPTYGLLGIRKELLEIKTTATGLVSRSEINRLKKITKRVRTARAEKVPVRKILPKIAQNIGMRASKNSLVYIYGKRIKAKGYTWKTYDVAGNYDFNFGIDFYKEHYLEIIEYNEAQHNPNITVKDRIQIESKLSDSYYKAKKNLGYE